MYWWNASTKGFPRQLIIKQGSVIFPISSGLNPSPAAGCNKAFVVFSGCRLRLLGLPSVRGYLGVYGF